jgi:prophage regulatory protein
MLPNSPTQLDETRPLSVLRLRAVKERTGLSQSGIYAKMSKGEFPRSIPLGGKAIGWRSDEITAWIEAQTAKRDAQGRPSGPLGTALDFVAKQERAS